MITLFYSLCFAAFCLSFGLLRVKDRVYRLLKLFGESYGKVSDSSLSDEEKELAVRALAVTSLKQLGAVAAAVALVGIATAAPGYLGSLLGLIDASALIAFSLDPVVILVTLVVGFLIVWIARRTGRTESAAARAGTGARYGPLDRMLHNLAFSSPAIQRTLCDLEGTLYGKRWSDLEVKEPIFITALPRAGTSLLLRVLSKHPGLAAHSYREMPFIRSPLLWSRLSSGFQVKTNPIERDHGDGLQLDADSPEAFEEILWLQEFPGHYGEKQIELWQHGEPGFADTLADHMRRLLALRGATADKPLRYVSKNNANVARLPALCAAFPDARILVPIRAPGSHALSMLRQHQGFMKMHAMDSFARQYMGDIGHFEFGALHKPMAFPGMEAIAESYEPGGINYWVGYWLCCYRFLQGQPQATFIQFEGFTQNPQLDELFAELNLPADEAAVTAGLNLIRPQEAKPVEGIDATLLKDAEALYRSICRGALREGE